MWTLAVVVFIGFVGFNCVKYYYSPFEVSSGNVYPAVKSSVLKCCRKHLLKVNFVVLDLYGMIALSLTVTAYHFFGFKTKICFLFRFKGFVLF